VPLTLRFRFLDQAGRPVFQPALGVRADVPLRVIGLVDLGYFADGAHFVADAIVENVFQRLALPKRKDVFMKSVNILFANLKRDLRTRRQGFDFAIHPA